jgi:hypothetical protein
MGGDWPVFDLAQTTREALGALAQVGLHLRVVETRRVVDALVAQTVVGVGAVGACPVAKTHADGLVAEHLVGGVCAVALA